eukprot:TRINITY_DN34442_c0_g1_i1.p1 TRINITY_DN34442_c0_g1~~TRINITY_DN34442_c0_g1_i1.p1  ORF type:complete len:469 (+),score=90.31 TRINITY_DN34442_c0_g1_i1:37-1407(+)
MAALKTPPISRLNLSHSYASPGGGTDMTPGRLPPDKTLGEWTKLETNYEGSYKPARMGLRRALDTGKMRNPLMMQQSLPSKSARRPLSATNTAATPSRPASSSRTRGSPSGASHMGALSSRSAPTTDTGPGMLQPQRIELPAYLNTPARRPEGEELSPEERTHSIRRIQDLELLTFACRRATKLREEGRAHFSLAVLLDNLGKYQKAIEAYNAFLRVCKECNDGQGSALAYHCIGVNYQLLGSGPAAVSIDVAQAVTEKAEGNSSGTTPRPRSEDLKPELLKKSIFYHNKHRENSDSVGKFVAHLNMGLVYSLLGEKEASTVNHQYALRYALQLHSLEGQSLAIGSLSFSGGIYDNDPEKMRVLIERYVELCNTLKQPRNQASALKKLGILASEQGNNAQSISYFEQAIECAREQGDREAEKDCAVRLGIAAGQARMAEHLSTILQNSVINGYAAD